MLLWTGHTRVLENGQNVYRIENRDRKNALGVEVGDIDLKDILIVGKYRIKKHVGPPAKMRLM